MVMNFEEKNILGKNKLLSKYWLSYPTQKNMKKFIFLQNYCIKKNAISWKSQLSLALLEPII